MPDDKLGVENITCVDCGRPLLAIHKRGDETVALELYEGASNGMSLTEKTAMLMCTACLGATYFDRRHVGAPVGKPTRFGT